MRSAGLCFATGLLLAACDDAVGTGYVPGSSGPAMEPAAVATPADRAAALGMTVGIDYSCSDAGTTAHVTLYGNEEMASVTIAGRVEEPVFLDCAPTRVGPECNDGDFRALINTVTGVAEFFPSAAEAAVSCREIQPE